MTTDSLNLAYFFFALSWTSSSVKDSLATTDRTSGDCDSLSGSLPTLSECGNLKASPGRKSAPNPGPTEGEGLSGCHSWAELGSQFLSDQFVSDFLLVLLQFCRDFGFSFPGWCWG